MPRFKFQILAVLVVLGAMAAGCAKKETGPPPPEIPPDGVTGIPAPTDRDSSMAPVDLPVAGAVKEVKAKVLDKDADDKTKGLVRIKVLDLDGPIEVSDNTHLEVWKPGSDPEEQKPELNDWASHEPAIAPGTWDVRLIYDEGNVCKAEGWIRNVPVVAGKLWKAEAIFAAPMQWVRVYGTLGGKDVADNMHIDVFKSGTDQQEFQPITSFWSTNKVPLLAGNYDLRVTYDKDNVKAKGALPTFAVAGNHGVQKKTIVLTKQ
ncbi:MAG TPA: hypothetical protein VKV95_11520 [Terriglobia bacterium]|nr:hypothetical protein [Terriglobia bacterium]